MDARRSFPSPDTNHGAAALVAALRRIVDEAPGLVSDRVRLLALELERAKDVFVALVGLFVVVVVLGLSAWLFLCVAAIASLHEAGIEWRFGAAIVAAVNLIGVALAVRMALARVPLLTLPATLRHLTLTDPGTAAGPADIPEGR